MTFPETTSGENWTKVWKYIFGTMIKLPNCDSPCSKSELPSEKECYNSCLEEDLCLVAVFIPGSKMCFLKSSIKIGRIKPYTVLFKHCYRGKPLAIYNGKPIIDLLGILRESGWR